MQPLNAQTPVGKAFLASPTGAFCERDRLEVQTRYELQAPGARIVGVVEVAECRGGLSERAAGDRRVVAAVTAATGGAAAIDHDVRVIEDVERLDAEFEVQ